MLTPCALNQFVELIGGEGGFYTVYLPAFRTHMQSIDVFFFRTVTSASTHRPLTTHSTAGAQGRTPTEVLEDFGREALNADCNEMPSQLPAGFAYVEGQTRIKYEQAFLKSNPESDTDDIIVVYTLSNGPGTQDSGGTSSLRNRLSKGWTRATNEGVMPEMNL